jgi:hypothetical protein
MTYSELVTKIRDYTEVDSNVFTSTIINGFIENAEFRILRDVDSDNNRKYATASVVVTQKYFNTPADLLVIRSAQVFNTDGTISFLDVRDMTFINEYNQSNTTGIPKYYANWDEDTVIIAPTPDQAYNVQLNYILKPTGLSANTATTYLSQQFPNGLLYACLVEAYGFLKGPQDMLQYYENRYKQAIEGFSLEQMGRRRTDEFLDGEPRIVRKPQ